MHPAPVTLLEITELHRALRNIKDPNERVLAAIQRMEIKLCVYAESLRTITAVETD